MKALRWKAKLTGGEQVVSWGPLVPCVPCFVIEPLNAECSSLLLVSAKVHNLECLCNMCPADFFYSLDVQRGITWPSLRPTERLQLTFSGPKGAEFAVLLGDKEAVREALLRRHLRRVQ